MRPSHEGRRIGLSERSGTPPVNQFVQRNHPAPPRPRCHPKGHVEGLGLRQALESAPGRRLPPKRSEMPSGGMSHMGLPCRGIYLGLPTSPLFVYEDSELLSELGILCTTSCCGCVPRRELKNRACAVLPFRCRGRAVSSPQFPHTLAKSAKAPPHQLHRSCTIVLYPLPKPQCTRLPEA